MEGQFSARDRERILSEMAESQLDVLIIDGGITGAGIAWDEASRGLKTGLLPPWSDIDNYKGLKRFHEKNTTPVAAVSSAAAKTRSYLATLKNFPFFHHNR